MSIYRKVIVWNVFDDICLSYPPQNGGYHAQKRRLSGIYPVQPPVETILIPTSDPDTIPLVELGRNHSDIREGQPVESRHPLLETDHPSETEEIRPDLR